MDNRTIKLPQHSWKMLQECLTDAGWALIPKDFHIAGKMDEDELIKVADIPKKSEERDEWSKVELSFEFTFNQIEVSRKAINFAIKGGKFFPNKYASKLIKAFLDE